MDGGLYSALSVAVGPARARLDKASGIRLEDVKSRDSVIVP